MTETQLPHQTPPDPPKLPLNPRPAILVGLTVIVIAIGGFGAWAAIAPIASAVIAPGVVTVDSNRKTVQHLEGGVVKELLVRDGDTVQAGDVLIRLDETRPRASLAIIQGRYDAARALEARLLAERDGYRKIKFPNDLRTRATEDNISEILLGQKRLFDARRSSLDGEASILKNRIVQLKDNITGIRAQQQSKERQNSLILEEIRSLQTLLEKGYTERPRLLALQREAARLEGEHGQHISEIARANTTVGETKLQIIQLRRDFQEQVVDDLRSVRTEISDLKERLGAAKYVLEHIEVRAPESGVVVGTEVHTVGGVIRAGDTILEIVPADDRLIVEAQVQPFDIDDIAVGQEANINFTAFKQRTTSTVSGEVIYISADRLTDQRSGEPYYLARIKVADDEVARLGERQLHPGMPAEVMIKTGERTALQYLAQPFLDSMNRAWREE